MNSKKEEIESLQAEISVLMEKAMVAYKSRNFKEEDRLDSLAKPLRERLEDLTLQRCSKCGDKFQSDQLDSQELCWRDGNKLVHPSHSWILPISVDYQTADSPYLARQNDAHLDEQRCLKCSVKQYHPQAHFPCKGRT